MDAKGASESSSEGFKASTWRMNEARGPIVENPKGMKSVYHIKVLRPLCSESSYLLSWESSSYPSGSLSCSRMLLERRLYCKNTQIR
jgi:hypothetical protein